MNEKEICERCGDEYKPYVSTYTSIDRKLGLYIIEEDYDEDEICSDCKHELIREMKNNGRWKR